MDFHVGDKVYGNDSGEEVTGTIKAIIPPPSSSEDRRTRAIVQWVALRSEIPLDELKHADVIRDNPREHRRCKIACTIPTNIHDREIEMTYLCSEHGTGYFCVESDSWKKGILNPFTGEQITIIECGETMMVWYDGQWNEIHDKIDK